MIKLVTRKQLAEALQVSVRTVDRMVKAGEIPALRVGHSVRFDLAEVLKVLGLVPNLAE